MSIKWISGHSPILRVLDGNVEVANMDISDKTTNEIHDLLAQYGFSRNAPASKDSPGLTDGAHPASSEL